MTSLLLESGLKAPSTFDEYHTGEMRTWQRHTGSQSRIGYVLPGGCYATYSIQSWTDEDFDILTSSDWAVGLSCVLESKSPITAAAAVKKPSYDRRRMLTADSSKNRPPNFLQLPGR